MFVAAALAGHGPQQKADWRAWSNQAGTQLPNAGAKLEPQNAGADRLAAQDILARFGARLFTLLAGLDLSGTNHNARSDLSAAPSRGADKLPQFIRARGFSVNRACAPPDCCSPEAWSLDVRVTLPAKRRRSRRQLIDSALTPCRVRLDPHQQQRSPQLDRTIPALPFPDAVVSPPSVVGGVVANAVKSHIVAAAMDRFFKASSPRPLRLHDLSDAGILLAVVVGDRVAAVAACRRIVGCSEMLSCLPPGFFDELTCRLYWLLTALPLGMALGRCRRARPAGFVKKIATNGIARAGAISR